MSGTYLPARVSDAGRLQFSEGVRRELDAHLSTLVGKPVLVHVHEDRAPLSERQRRWYFGQVLGRIEQATGQGKDDLHWFFKDLFLGAPEHRLIALVDSHGEVVDERNVFAELSITKLTTKRMARYCDQIREFAALRLEIDIPNPDPKWRAPA